MKIPVAFLVPLLLSCSPRAHPVAASPLPLGAHVSQAPEWATEYLTDTARTAKQSGAGELQIVGFGATAPGDAVDGVIFIPEGRCALVYARGTQSIDDLDLLSFGDDGTQFGVDEAPDDLPTLLLCPEHETRIYVSARTAQGKGLVAVGLQDLSESTAEKVARAVGARNHLKDPEDLEQAWPGLDEALARHRQEMSGEWIDQRRVALPVDSRVPTRLSVTVPKDRCLDAFLLPTEDVAQVELVASEQNGRLFARGLEQGEVRSLLLCAQGEEKTVSLEVRPHAGRGLAVLALSTTRALADGLELDDEIPVFQLQPLTGKSELQQAARRASALGAAQLQKSLSLALGEILSWSFKSQGCARVDLIPLGELAGYSARIWNKDGHLLASTSQALSGPLFVCAEGEVRLDLEATSRPGPLKVEVRYDKKSEPALLQAPLSASRLLVRSYEAGLLELPSGAGTVTRVELQAEQLTKIPLSVPASHCQTIVLGKGPGGYGLDARILSHENKVVVDAAQGNRSLQVRACAPENAHLTAVLELRTVRGESEALWLSRQTKYGD